MKTTLELPDELARRIKIRAAERNQKLKDTVAQLLELGLAQSTDVIETVQPPTPIRLKKKERITIVDIESAIATGRN